MHCSIYKGRRAADTYIFVAVPGDFSAIPPQVMQLLGTPEHVMDLVLTPERKLARTDPHTIMRSLLQRGCYVQLPPKDDEQPHPTTGMSR